DPPGSDIAPHTDGSERLAPISIELDLLHWPTPAVTMIVGEEPLHQSLAANLLQARIERRAHGETAAVELVFAEEIDDVAAHFLGKEFRRGEPRTGLAYLNAERLGLCLFGVLFGDKAVLDHAVDDPVAAGDGALRKSEPTIAASRPSQARGRWR